jgi:hypothetical protein
MCSAGSRRISKSIRSTKPFSAWARRRAIERLGLPQVRAHRLRQLDEEERAWTVELSTREGALPDLAAILLVHVVRAGSPQ